ncbi:MAG: hypothetical protein JSW11_09085 [Candidatus Heimdallarchaeota archaeon]|nr:MAG: hypothetical protein JSW11_09085 [Candidatus Heimdallarchaeota archaeon]
MYSHRFKYKTTGTLTNPTLKNNFCVFKSPFSQKAPIEVVKNEKEKLKGLESKKTQLEEQLEIQT